MFRLRCQHTSHLELYLLPIWDGLLWPQGTQRGVKFYDCATPAAATALAWCKSYSDVLSGEAVSRPRPTLSRCDTCHVWNSQLLRHLSCSKQPLMRSGYVYGERGSNTVMHGGMRWKRQRGVAGNRGARAARLLAECTQTHIPHTAYGVVTLHR